MERSQMSETEVQAVEQIEEGLKAGLACAHACKLNTTYHERMMKEAIKVNRATDAENQRIKEEVAVLKSQVENADVNLEQVRLALKERYDAENQRLREALDVADK